MLVAQGGFPSVPCGAACAKVDCVWGSHRAAAQLEHISPRVIAIRRSGGQKYINWEKQLNGFFQLMHHQKQRYHFAAILWLHTQLSFLKTIFSMRECGGILKMPMVSLLSDAYSPKKLSSNLLRNVLSGAGGVHRIGLPRYTSLL